MPEASALKMPTKLKVHDIMMGAMHFIIKHKIINAVMIINIFGSMAAVVKEILAKS